MAKVASRALAALALAGSLIAGPAHAEWLRAETEHFIIYGDTSERAIRRYARKVERFDSLLRTYYPIQVDHEIPKLEIFLADGMSDLRAAYPEVDSSVGGWYAPNSGRIHAVVNTSSPMEDEVLFHEYAHHFMFQMASAAYPAWFVEGFAEYYATAELEDRIRIGLFNPGRVNSLAVASNSRVPLEDVIRWRVLPSGRFRGADYYAESWALTHYMLSDPERTAALGRYLNAVANGADPVEALETSIGRTASQLQGDLRRYLFRGITVLTPQVELPVAEVSVSPLPESAARLIWLDLRLGRIDPRRLDEDDEQENEEDDDSDKDRTRKRAEARAEAAADREQLIRQALASAARYPGDRFATLVEAKAHRLDRDPAAALTTLEPLLAASPDDADALRLSALALLDQAAAEPDGATPMVGQARAHLAKALDADPLDFRTYLALDDTRQGAAGYPTANDLSTLLVALQLAPQSFDTRMRTARVLMARERPREAVTVLTPVANSPHGSGTRRQARTLLDQARAAAGLAPETSAPPPPDPEGGVEPPPNAAAEAAA